MHADFLPPTVLSHSCKLTFLSPVHKPLHRPIDWTKLAASLSPRHVTLEPPPFPFYTSPLPLTSFTSKPSILSAMPSLHKQLGKLSGRLKEPVSQFRHSHVRSASPSSSSPSSSAVGGEWCNGSLHYLAGTG